MSDRTRRTAWEGIKKKLMKPFVRKRNNSGEGKKLIITALISIDTCKSTVLLKDACHISATCLPAGFNNAKEVGWWILPYMG